MIKERLKEIELRITELSDYLNISRPTMYKFIDLYDSGDKSAINPRVLKLFAYLEENPLAGRKAAISFILSHLSENEASENHSESADKIAELSPAAKFIAENPDTPKSQFFNLAAQRTDFDEAIRYLLKIFPLLRNRRLTEEQIALLKPYDDIREIIENRPE